MQVDRDVSSITGPLPRTVVLPAIPGMREYNEPLTDRIGEQVRTRLPVVGAGLLVGGLGGAVVGASGGGLLGGIAGGLAGSLLGAGLVVGAGVALDEVRDARPTPAGTPAGAGSGQQPEQLKVMTWNVHGGMGPPKATGVTEAELDRIAEVVRREQPDVLMLQEVDKFSTRAQYHDTLEELAERLDPTSAVYTPRTTYPWGQQEGGAVMTFGGARIQDARALVEPDPYGSGPWRQLRPVVEIIGEKLGLDVRAGGRHMDEYRPRATADTMVRTAAGNDVRVLSGHYSWNTKNTDYQQVQIRPLTGVLAAWDGPTILGADFNVRSETRSGARERAWFAEAGMHDSMLDAGLRPNDPARSTFGKAEGLRIDRIYVSDDLRVRQAGVVRTGTDGPMPSDHHPVVTTVQLGPGADPEPDQPSG